MKKLIFGLSISVLVACGADSGTGEGTQTGVLQTLKEIKKDKKAEAAEKTVACTANFNYVDGAGSYSFKGLPLHDVFDRTISGTMYESGILELKFVEEDGDKYIVFRIEGGDQGIGTGSYSLATPYKNASNMRLSINSSGKKLPLYAAMNSDPDGAKYKEEVIQKSGVLTITKLENDHIEGTFSGNLYGGFDGMSQTKKLVINNLNFSGKIKRKA